MRSDRKRTRPWKAVRTAALCVAVSLTACNSLIAHNGLDPEFEAQVGNLYPGVRLNLESWSCFPSVMAEYKPVVAAFLAPLTIALLIVDLPLSAAGDTLLLPIDLAVEASAPPIDWKSASCG